MKKESILKTLKKRTLNLFILLGKPLFYSHPGHLGIIFGIPKNARKKIFLFFKILPSPVQHQSNWFFTLGSEVQWYFKMKKRKKRGNISKLKIYSSLYKCTFSCDPSLDSPFIKLSKDFLFISPLPLFKINIDTISIFWVEFNTYFYILNNQTLHCVLTQ